MLPLTITDNYILITSDEEIKEGEWCYIPFEHSIKRFGKYFADDWKKVIAHLPITDSADLRGVPLLPPLLSGEDDVENMAKEYINDEWEKDDDAVKFGIKVGYGVGYNKAKEKYRLSEEDMRKAIKLSYSKGLAKPNSGRLSDIPNVQNEIIQSLSQPKMPTSFSPKMVCHQCNGDESTDSCYCHYGSYKIVPQIINGVMQGEWIY